MSNTESSMARWYKHGKALIDEISNSKPEASEAYIWFMGQHGFAVNLANVIFHIDVILNDFVDREGKSRREYPAPFDPGEPQRVDYVLCSHNHGDHLNMKTLLPLAAANPGARFVVPAPWTAILKDAGIGEERIIPARSGEEIKLKGPRGDLQILPVPAVHTKYIQEEGEKNDQGDYTSLGFIIKGEGISLYHCGDTWITPPLVEELKARGPLDIALLPINGTDWERTATNCIGNVSYLDAAKLAKAVPVDLVIPSHYDMMGNNSENPARFAEAMYALCPQKRYHVSALGERFIYKKD
ncbi:MAG: MBL fold metallo-hydrolase [Treponema sp.]|nr:MBL fold metallo-hydrolase [Treponema sp.]